MGIFDNFDLGGGLRDGLFSTGATAARHANQDTIDFIQQLFGRPWGGPGQSGTLFGQMLKGYDQGLPLMQQAVDVQKEGGQKALSAIGNQGATAYRGIQDLVKQAGSGANQRMASSGLYSSSAGQTAEDQARYQGQQAIGNLGSQLGGLFAGQHSRNAQATASALQGLAQFWAQRGRDLGQLGTGFANIRSGFQHQPGQSPFSQIAGPLAFLMSGGIG